MIVFNLSKILLREYSLDQAVYGIVIAIWIFTVQLLTTDDLESFIGSVILRNQNNNKEEDAKLEKSNESKDKANPDSPKKKRSNED